MNKLITADERNSILCEMWMFENPPKDRIIAAINNLHEEKELLLDILLSGDSEARQVAWKQLEEVNWNLNQSDWYITIITNQDNQN
jgi:hypothetical protein